MFNGYDYLTYTVKLKDGSKHVKAISIYVEPEEMVLAAVDEVMRKRAEEAREAKKEQEVYDITSMDEDSVDVSDRPSLAFEPIYFDFDKAYIRSDARDAMAKNIKVLNENPEVVIRVMSYCDSLGSKAYNMILSARRAKSTVDYIISQGIEANRIVASVGVGEDDLVNDCGDGVPCTKAQHQMNRRSELTVVGSLKR